MIKKLILFIFVFISCASIFAYPDNEDGMYEDMLQPAFCFLICSFLFIGGN
ncbi:hypothetical protein KAH27_03395 [bacterium]|nr:hypothetical protein [bacterium]